MIDLRALYYGLSGAGRLIRLDVSGLPYITGGAYGFWVSLIYSAAIVLPLYGFVHLLEYDPQQVDGLRYLLVNLETYALAWLFFPFLMERVTHFMNRRERFLDFIIPYNWLSCLYNIMFMILGLARSTGMLGLEAAASISVGLNIIGLVWIGNLARHSLNIPISAAVGIVILDLFFSLIIALLNAAFLLGQ